MNKNDNKAAAAAFKSTNEDQHDAHDDARSADMKSLPIHPTKEDLESDSVLAIDEFKAGMREVANHQAQHDGYKAELLGLTGKREAVLQSGKPMEDLVAELVPLPIKAEVFTEKVRQSKEKFTRAVENAADAGQRSVGHLNRKFQPLTDRVANIYATYRSLMNQMPVGLVIGTLRNHQTGGRIEAEKYVVSVAEYIRAFEVLAPEVERQCDGLEDAFNELQKRIDNLKFAADKALAVFSKGGAA